MATTTTTQTHDALIHDIDKLKRNAAQVAQDVRNHATAHVDATKRQVTDSIQSVQDNAASHPFAVLGIGFVLGLFVGLRLRG